MLAIAAVAILPSSAASAQAAARPAPPDSVSAPITGVTYDVTFGRTNAASGTFDVDMTFSTDGSAPVLLSLPAWTPGAYEITNFAKSVLSFTAMAGRTALTWDKVDFDTWRVRPTGPGPVSIRFTYAADSLDNAMAWADKEFLLFNGTNVFMYPEGRPLSFAATVKVHTDTAWRVVTGMTKGTAAGTYTATNYHDLVDMPFFVGVFDLDSTRVAEKWVRFASYPKGAVPASGRTTVLAQLAKVIPPQIAVFGEAPWDSYTVMQIVDSAFGGASGLEHQNSHVDVLSPGFVGSDFQPSLYAHEIFHSWNVKRLRPRDMWPYDYSRPQPTPWLWVSEGITDYYADLAEVRGGLINETQFYSLTQDKINEVNALAPTSLEDASINTWIHPKDGTEYLYYPKGSLAGLMLDILIRGGSDNAKSLDTVMRELYQTTYKQGRGFTSEEWWAAVSKAAGGMSFTDFHRKFIDGRDPYPWANILSQAGIRVTFDRVPRMGVYSQQGPAGIVVTGTEPGGSADVAGVKPGDVLISIGDIPVDDQQFGAKFRAKYATTPEGGPLPIVVTRGGQRMSLTGKLMFASGNVRLEADPGANAKAVKIREAILKGG